MTQLSLLRTQLGVELPHRRVFTHGVRKLFFSILHIHMKTLILELLNINALPDDAIVVVAHAAWCWATAQRSVQWGNRCLPMNTTLRYEPCESYTALPQSYDSLPHDTIVVVAHAAWCWADQRAHAGEVREHSSYTDKKAKGSGS